MAQAQAGHAAEVVLTRGTAAAMIEARVARRSASQACTAPAGPLAPASEASP